ncbi:MAG TPA: DNA replication/repair protein RecF [Clostridiales bacterium]|nr:DNA replication/repair protein RecF [Clostridiales bacterium]
MIIKSLNLMNYRNYDKLNIEFSKGINILHGDNAQGKTNILEAIYMCGTTKSHKGSKDREIIKFEKDESHIKLILNKNKIDHRIDLHLKKNKAKGAAINGFPIKKQGELFGMLNLVFFSPEDLDIIKKGPQERRKFLDIELCQINKMYLYHIANYNKIVIQRNSLLKQIQFKKELYDTLSIWDEKLIEHGINIIKLRNEFIKQLNNLIINIHKKLTSGKEKLVIQYEPNVEKEQFEKKLKLNIQRDIITGTTNIGPHRDDMCFMINDIDVKKYGSQGQQRTAALSLKLAEIELVKTIIKDNPILLLDDVLSELDRTRQNDLLDSIGDIQTIITSTGLEEYIVNRFKYNKIFHVVEGRVTSENYLL